MDKIEITRFPAVYNGLVQEMKQVHITQILSSLEPEYLVVGRRCLVSAAQLPPFWLRSLDRLRGR
eukprot:2968153-Pyramimonas_sp.AAC.1